MSPSPQKGLKLLTLRTDLYIYISEEIPGFKIRPKKDSPLMRVLSSLLFFNKGFMNRYITTIYPVIYVPDWWGKHKNMSFSELGIIAHEYVHLRDRKKLGWIFNLLYLSPQIFSLLFFAAFWNLWFLLALLFLLPWPSPGRAWLEYRGYRMSMAFYYWMKKEKCNIEMLVDEFTGSNYYYMLPFRKFLIKKFNKDYDKIVAGDLTSELKELKYIIEKRV
tara:strand:- start:765 stop:1421 length:657 start_codon:yes stop_codon:yes gene_type:complete